MLTYDLTNIQGPLYKGLYEYIKGDIISGRLSAGTKMPSKRTLASNLSVSLITIENTYDLLISEGYIKTVPRKGYYVTGISELLPHQRAEGRTLHIQLPAAKKASVFDFSAMTAEASSFPFSVWAKLMRDVISNRETVLLETSPCGGVRELREAIAGHLSSFRGMAVDPDQIIVGAGTEYLYGLLIKLLGTDKCYCIENPGYKKLLQIYQSNQVTCKLAGLDESGVMVEELNRCGAKIAHISPTHHFPTGITMPAARRHALLAWAGEVEGRYIIEDDYDSEFRLKKKPIPPLQTLDSREKVIYMNTFSKSLASTIRISYMVLPEHLANRFYKELSFYSCTVSTFEQYTLSEFIRQGYFEKHINRMRLKYGRKRSEIMKIIQKTLSEKECQIIENDSGLHFLLQFRTDRSDQELQRLLSEEGIRIGTISDFDMGSEIADTHQFILSYSNMDIGGLEKALKMIKNLL